jgi:hypothetical protein
MAIKLSAGVLDEEVYKNGARRKLYVEEMQIFLY